MADDEIVTSEQPIDRGGEGGARRVLARPPAGAGVRVTLRSRLQLERPRRVGGFLMRRIGRPQARGEREERPQIPFREDGMVVIRRCVVGTAVGVAGGLGMGWALGNFGVGVAIGVAGAVFICAIRGGRPPRG